MGKAGGTEDDAQAVACSCPESLETARENGYFRVRADHRTQGLDTGNEAKITVIALCIYSFIHPPPSSSPSSSFTSRPDITALVDWG